MNTYVKEYTSFMTDIRHKSLNTVESYKRDVTQYISYLDGTGVTDISYTTKTTVLSYLIYPLRLFRHICFIFKRRAEQARLFQGHLHHFVRIICL